MTILEMLSNRHADNKLMQQACEKIKDNYTNLVNDNYEIIIFEDGELGVKIPSMEKRNEFEYKQIGEYDYPLVMCMRISDVKKAEVYEYVLDKFMSVYREKIELLAKDIVTTNKLMQKIKSMKDNIDYLTYASIGAVIVVLISLCVYTRMSPTTRNILIFGMVLFSAVSLVGQFSKEKQVKKIIDAYISIIKTEWYQNQLMKEYIFLCNYTG